MSSLAIIAQTTPILSERVRHSWLGRDDVPMTRSRNATNSIPLYGIYIIYFLTVGRYLYDTFYGFRRLVDSAKRTAIRDARGAYARFRSEILIEKVQVIELRVVARFALDV